MIQLHPQVPAALKLHAQGKLSLEPMLIEDPRDLAGVPADLIDAFLELVEFLDHDDRDHHIVFLERKDRPRIVEQHVGIQYEYFFHS